MGVPGASSDARSNPPAAARLLHRAGDGCQSEEDELDEEDELLDEPDEVDAPAAAGLPEGADDEDVDDEESEPEVAGVGDELARLSVR